MNKKYSYAVLNYIKHFIIIKFLNNCIIIKNNVKENGYKIINGRILWKTWNQLKDIIIR